MAGLVSGVKAGSVDLDREIMLAMLNSMDDQSLWTLARGLHERGKIDITSMVPDVGPGAGAYFWGQPSPAAAAAAWQRPVDAAWAQAAATYAAEGCGAWAPQTSEQQWAPPEPAEKQAQKPRQQPAPEDEEPVDPAKATCLILRNLPKEWDQFTCQEWVDRSYKGLYDFLLWFPPKKTGTTINTCSYAFVNFLTPHHASRFKLDFNMHRFRDKTTGQTAQWALNIALAKVQGFAANYVRFNHMLDGSFGSSCTPFFDENAIAQLTPEEREQARRHTQQLGGKGRTASAEGTTLVIRNLPARMESQQEALDWFDEAGFKGQYDFFAYIPRRSEARAKEGTGLPYAFVNFASAAGAKSCLQKLHGVQLRAGDEILNVVHSKVQGYQECVERFDGLRSEGGRIDPFCTTPMKEAGGSSPPAAPPADGSFQ